MNTACYEVHQRGVGATKKRAINNENGHINHADGEQIATLQTVTLNEKTNQRHLSMMVS